MKITPPWTTAQHFASRGGYFGLRSPSARECGRFSDELVRSAPSIDNVPSTQPRTARTRVGTIMRTANEFGLAWATTATATIATFGAPFSLALMSEKILFWRQRTMSDDGRGLGEQK